MPEKAQIKLPKVHEVSRFFRRYIPQFVYGAFDGTVTTFAVVSAAAGAGLSSNIIIILGLANLIADGFSMGASAFLSATSRKRTTSKKPSNAPLKTSLATFSAFVAVGFIPVLPFVLDLSFRLTMDNQQLFAISGVMTFIAFVCVGIAKAEATSTSVARSVTESVLLGVVAASLAYFAGSVLQSIFGS